MLVSELYKVMVNKVIFLGFREAIAIADPPYIMSVPLMLCLGTICIALFNDVHLHLIFLSVSIQISDAF